ncbi:YqaE/Pmp3 family membrane protein [Acaryochloris marina NIES-2412]|uniref:YqaE/Pmp3 family membrane protein n=1 Tax=Acaryochloris marina TaxID=155978 RepID=UPI0040586B1C
MSLLNVILAIVLPPVSIFLNEGIGATLLISILLTLVGWIPGSIHAVWVLSKRGERARI